MRTYVLCALVLAIAFPLRGSAADAAPNLHRGPNRLVGRGVHLWYEIKSDPEDPTHLIICGTKWDAATNGPYGFVSASADSGATWRAVLEDRASIWVTEQSCAFGPNHRAYFVSEAAKETSHKVTNSHLGTTRLFVSLDGGQTWAEKMKTGWADYSTSAVSSSSKELYTFFQETWVARSGNKQAGNSVGLLIFAPDGSAVEGPLFSAGELSFGNQGIYASDAVSLRSGAVVAMYYALEHTSEGDHSDVGVIRGSPSSSPPIESTTIAQVVDDPKNNCVNSFNGSLAYEPGSNTLFLAYTDGCGPNGRLLLTTSNDDGHTWSKSAPVVSTSHRTLQDPSLAPLSPGNLGLVWRDGPLSTHWLFSVIRANALLDPAVELSKGDDGPKISDDSLETWVRSFSADPGDSADSDKPITVSVQNLANGVWRSRSLIRTPDGMIAIWPTRTPEGMGLCSTVLTLTPSPSVPVGNAGQGGDCGSHEVTATATIFYSGDRQLPGQHFDPSTDVLSLYLALANRSNQPLGVPITVEVADLTSPLGDVSILNADNGKRGAGAMWDISHSLTGNSIPPGGSSNPFCLRFHLDKSSQKKPALPDAFDLLTVKLRVFARGACSADCR